MLRSLRIGTAFGIGIYLHWTFFLLPLWVILNTWDQPGADLVLNLAVLAAGFGCVVLHELGRALTAPQFGIGTRDISLYPIGGVARLERMTDKPGEELLIAVAGPAVNVVIVVLLGLVLCAAHLVDPGLLAGSFAGKFLLFLCVI